MGLEADAAFALIQRSLEEFTAGVGKAMSDQSQAQETLDALEYELEQLRTLIAEHALDAPASALPPASVPVAVVDARPPKEAPAQFAQPLASRAA
jgi:hypothetical protein